MTKDEKIAKALSSPFIQETAHAWGLAVKDVAGMHVWASSCPDPRKAFANVLKKAYREKYPDGMLKTVDGKNWVPATL